MHRQGGVERWGSLRGRPRRGLGEAASLYPGNPARRMEARGLASTRRAAESNCTLGVAAKLLRSPGEVERCRRVRASVRARQNRWNSTYTPEFGRSGTAALYSGSRNGVQGWPQSGRNTLRLGDLACCARQTCERIAVRKAAAAARGNVRLWDDVFAWSCLAGGRWERRGRGSWDSDGDGETPGSMSRRTADLRRMVEDSCRTPVLRDDRAVRIRWG